MRLSLSAILLGIVALALAGQILASLLLSRSFSLTASSDLIRCVLLLIGVLAMAMNIRIVHGRARMFWGLMTAGVALWLVTQAWWTYSEVFLRQEVPNPWAGDVVLFIHLVPIMAALALQLQLRDDEKHAGVGILDFALLLLWWLYVYLLIVTPWQFVSVDFAQYGSGFNTLYLVENIAVLAMLGLLWLRISGTWRTIYAHLFGAALLYNLGSYFANDAIDLKRYYTGCGYDIPIVASLGWFVVAGIVANKVLLQPARGDTRQYHPLIVWSPRLAMVAVLSLPVFAFWAVAISEAPDRVKKFRLLCSLGGMLTLTFLLLLRQQLLNRRLTASLRETQKAEKLQSALYRIAETASSVRDLQQFYAAIHRIIAELMYAKNFYIALYEPATQFVSFPYFVDEFEPPPSPRKLTTGLADHVLRTGKPLFGSPEDFKQLARRGEAELPGGSLDWMGVPLKDNHETFGVMVIRSYEKSVWFGEKEKEILTFVSRHIASAIEHKRKEEALRESEKNLAREEELDRFFTLSLEMLGIADFDGYFKRLNPAWQTLLGFTMEELRAKPYLEFIHPEDRESTLAEASKLTAGISTISFENRCLSKDGSYKWLLWTAAPFPGQRLIYCVARDISERKRAEQALKESETRTRLIVDSACEAFISMDSGGLVTDWNAQAEKTFGWSRLEVIGQRLDATIIPQKYREAHTRGLQHFLNTGEGPVLNKRIEITALRRDRSEFPVELSISSIQVGDHYAFNAFLSDISDRKRAEQALHESEEKYRRLLQNIPDVVWTSTREGKTTFITSNIEEVTGYTTDEIYHGGEDLWFERIHPEDLQGARDAYKALFNSKAEFDAEYRIQHKNGSWIWLQKKAVSTYEKDGVQYADGVLLDISERKAYQDTIEQQNIKLEERNLEVERANNLKSQFLANMSHELRTPLNAILGFSELLQENVPSLTDKHKRWLEHIQKGGKHLLELVNDILDLSKIESGQMELKREVFAVADCLPEVLSTLLPLAMAKEIEMPQQIDEHAVVDADRIRLKQILYNLLSNAIKFTPAKGSIRIEVAAEQEFVRFSIADSGIA